MEIQRLYKLGRDRIIQKTNLTQTSHFVCSFPLPSSSYSKLLTYVNNKTSIEQI